MTAVAPAPISILAFDFGERKVGVAVGNTVSGSAEPLATLHYSSRDDLFGKIGLLVDKWGPGEFVVGRPLAKDGTSAPITHLAERFARRLHGRFERPVQLVDERYSSLEAQADIRRSERPGEDSGGRSGKVAGAAEEDAVAAAIILRQYLHEH